MPDQPAYYTLSTLAAALVSAYAIHTPAIDAQPNRDALISALYYSASNITMNQAEDAIALAIVTVSTRAFVERLSPLVDIVGDDFYLNIGDTHRYVGSTTCDRDRIIANIRSHAAAIVDNTIADALRPANS